MTNQQDIKDGEPCEHSQSRQLIGYGRDGDNGYVILYCKECSNNWSEWREWEASQTSETVLDQAKKLTELREHEES